MYSLLLMFLIVTIGITIEKSSEVAQTQISKVTGHVVKDCSTIRRECHAENIERQ